MLHQMFSEYFFHPSNESAFTSLESAYSLDEVSLIYFTENDSEKNTASQLADFKNGREFAQFKKQYESLLSSLDQWCVTHEVQKTLFDNLDIEGLLYLPKQIPAFELLKQRLFNGYYSIREAILYREGKQSLEELSRLLHDKNIREELKKNILCNLQISIGVCSDGTLTNIIDAKDNLKGSLNSYSLIMNIKRVLVQQAALLFLHQVIKTYPIGNEIHYVNAFHNHVALNYGLPKRTDQFINSLHLGVERLEQFAISVERYMTPARVLEHLISQLIPEFSTMHERLKRDFFSATISIPYTNIQGKELLNQTEELIDVWNKKYSSLMTLNFYSLLNWDENNQISLIPLNETAIKAKITTVFRNTFLTEKCQPITLTNSSKSISLTWDTGQLWFEKDELIVPPEDSKLFSEIEWTQKYYWFFANELLRYPTQETAISSLLQSIDISSSFACWMEEEHFELIALSLRLRPTSIETNAIWWLAYWSYQPKAKELLTKLIDKGFVTKELLSSTAKSGDVTGINPIWCLSYWSHQPSVVALLINLVEQDLVTKAQLTSVARASDVAGTNAIWWLAYRIEQPEVADLFMNLVNKNLVTQAQLMLAATSGDKIWSNAIWWLAHKIHHPRIAAIFMRLVDKNLITQEQLQLTYANQNAISLLAKNQHISEISILLQTLNHKGIISIDQLQTNTITTNPNHFFISKETKRKREEDVTCLESAKNAKK